jgi:hypothetical protein
VNVGMGSVGAVLAGVCLAVSSASAQETSKQMSVGGHTVKAEKYCDCFTGIQVLVTRVTDPEGKVVNGANVEFDPDKGTRLRVTTPSGIQVTIDETCEIRPQPVRISQFNIVAGERGGSVGTWQSAVEEPELLSYQVREIPADPRQRGVVLGQTKPLGAHTDYSIPLGRPASSVGTIQLVAFIKSTCESEIILAEVPFDYTISK